MQRNALKLFGIQDLAAGAGDLKQQLLLYEEIFFDPSQVEALAESMRGMTIYTEWPDTRRRLRPDDLARRVEESLQAIEWLQQRGVLRKISMVDELGETLPHPMQWVHLLRGAHLQRYNAEPSDEQVHGWLARAADALRQPQKALPLVYPAIRSTGGHPGDWGFDVQLRSMMHVTLARGVAARHGLTSLFDEMDDLVFSWAGGILGEEQAEPAQLVEVVLSAFPAPDERTSYEDILRFRDLPVSRELYARLRDWLSEVPTSKRPNFLAESIQNGLVQYQAHMERQNLSMVLGKIRLFFLSMGRALSGRLRPSDAAQIVSSVVDADAHFHTAEAKAPRKEIAYIARAHDQFGSK